MPEKPKISPSLGLELTLDELKGAFLAYQNRKLSVINLFSIPLSKDSTDSNVKPLDNGKEQKKLLSTIKKSLVVTGLLSKDVLVRRLSIQLVKDKDIDAVLDFQAEPILPYGIDDAIVDRITLDKNKESSQLAIVAVKKESIAQHLAAWHAMRVEPEVVSCTPVALAAFANLFNPKQSAPYLHIHMGRNEITCILMSGGKLVASQSINSGVNNWIHHLESDLNLFGSEAEEALNTIDFSSLPEKEYPALAKHMQRVRNETTRVVYALRKQAAAEATIDIMATGEGALINHAAEAICSQFDHKFIFIKPPSTFAQPATELQRYAVPIGMALTTLPSGGEQVNFRQKEFVYPSPWKRIKKPIATYLFLCFLCAIALYFFGVSYIKVQEDKLKKEYVDLLSLVKKSYREFEQKISKNGDRSETMPIQLTQQGLSKRLKALEKEILSTPDIFPLSPSIPTVSDTLAWLSSLPHVVGDGRETRPSRLQLESYSYKILKRPEKNKKNEHYQARVEIEFTTPTPRFAREFHDILLAPNAMVDPKGDIKWSAERGKYRASFFLKGKPAYPVRNILKNG